MQNSKFIEKLFLKHNINFDTKLNKDRFIKLYSDIKNPFLIENEIIKFSLLDKKIDGLDIEKNSLINTEQTIFKFYKPLLEKDISSVLSIYEELLALKNDPLIIIKILANLLFKFKFYKLLKFNNISDFEICNILNVKTFQLYDYKKFNNVSLEYINHILDELYKTEYNIISSNFDKQQALKLFFLKNVY
jgi:DNA polymerase III delta subunit